MGISVWQLVILLLIVVLLFGTKKLRGMGEDLGGAVKGFRKGMKDGEKTQDEAQNKDAADKQIAHEEKVIEPEVVSREKDKS